MLLVPLKFAYCTEVKITCTFSTYVHIGIQLLVQEICLSLTNHPGQLSLAIPRDAMSTGQKAVMLCDWEKTQIWCCLQITLCDPYLSE